MDCKNSKALFYLNCALKGLVPDSFYRIQLEKLLNTINFADAGYIDARVNYYNKLENHFELPQEAVQMCQLNSKKQSAYFFDTRDHMRYFPKHFAFDYQFGDVIDVPPTPRILKSRPIEGDVGNSVLLKLNKVRHYNFVDKDIPYQDKKNMLVWRGKAKRKHYRSQVVEQWYRHPLCDIGQSNTPLPDQDPMLMKPFMSIKDQLAHKFVLSIEGNDVATNLKWIMSSNSLCFMRKPRYETWFMEGKLIPGFHYVELRDDFSDIEEKIAYYLEHEAEALQIINNAQQWVEQFRLEKRELLIGLLVLEKYFSLSGQKLTSKVAPHPLSTQLSTQVE